MKKILVVDDDQAILNFLNLFLMQTGKFQATMLNDSRRACSMISEGNFDILLLDMDMPHVSGLDILKYLDEEDIDIVTIVITGIEDIDLAISAMKMKTFEYLLKPIDEKKTLAVLDNAIAKAELRSLKRDSGKPLSHDTLFHREEFKDFVTRDEEMINILHFVEKFAPTENSILIWGESGTGKELVARSIHNLSGRKDGNFVAVNSGAFANELFMSEFFGHDKGAFTGAVADKKGFIEEAAGGTLFLDEIGELPLPIQVKLLRVLQEEEFYRLGSTRNRKANARIIAATNKNLFEEIQAGNFRKDLFFRLNIHSIYLPPLRERKNDIELLSYHYLTLYAKKYGKPVNEISPEVLRLFKGYSFPGNVRELMNIINSSIIIETGSMLREKSLPHYFHENSVPAEQPPAPAPRNDNASFPTLKEAEVEHIRRALAHTNMNRTKAAVLLGISRVSLISKIKQYGL